MAYKVIILYRLYMPSYFLGTFTEYPYNVVNGVGTVLLLKGEPAIYEDILPGSDLDGL